MRTNCMNVQYDTHTLDVLCADHRTSSFISGALLFFSFSSFIFHQFSLLLPPRRKGSSSSRKKTPNPCSFDSLCSWTFSSYQTNPDKKINKTIQVFFFFSCIASFSGISLPAVRLHLYAASLINMGADVDTSLVFQRFLYCLPLALYPQEIIQFRGDRPKRCTLSQPNQPGQCGTNSRPKKFTTQRKKAVFCTHHRLR